MTTTVELKDFIAISKDGGWLRDTAEVKALRTLQIANAALKLLADGQRRTAGQIAKGIGKVGFLRYTWQQPEGAEVGEPCEVNGQIVGQVMSKLIKMGKVKRETVDGEPMQVIKQPKRWRGETEAEEVTIIPKINYYSLV